MPSATVKHASAVAVRRRLSSGMQRPNWATGGRLVSSERVKINE